MRHRVARVAVLIAFTFASSGCLPSGRGGEQPVERQSLGTFALSSDSLGHVSLAPASCSAGDRQFFLGADFEDDKNGFVLRLVIDPLYGPAVRVFSQTNPFEEARVFRRGDCRVFQFSLDSTAWRINRVQDYRVSLDLDCARGGDAITGHVSAEHCH
jgi:hypothetical protein